MFQKVSPTQSVTCLDNLPAFCFTIQVNNYKHSLNSNGMIFVSRFVNIGHVLLKLCLLYEDTHTHTRAQAWQTKHVVSYSFMCEIR